MAAAANFRFVNTKADDPALIIYTSGTTGAPKGRRPHPSGWHASAVSGLVLVGSAAKEILLRLKLLLRCLCLGALHAHRTLLGHMPGIEFPQNFFPQPGDVF